MIYFRIVVYACFFLSPACFHCPLYLFDLLQNKRFKENDVPYCFFCSNEWLPIKIKVYFNKILADIRHWKRLICSNKRTINFPFLNKEWPFSVHSMNILSTGEISNKSSQTFTDEIFIKLVKMSVLFVRTWIKHEILSVC